MDVRLSLVMPMIAAVALAGCSLVGYSIDEKLGVESSKRSDRVYVDGNGEGRHIVPSTHKNRIESGLGAAGMEIDKAIFDVLTTRREENDMAMRDEPGCPDGEIKVCSIAAGCACKERRSSPSQ